MTLVAPAPKMPPTSPTLAMDQALSAFASDDVFGGDRLQHFVATREALALLKVGRPGALANKARLISALAPEIARAFNAAAATVPSLAAARRSLEAGGSELIALWDGAVDAMLSRIRATMRQALFSAAAAEARRIEAEAGCSGDFDVLADGVRLAVGAAEALLRERLRASGRASVQALVSAVGSGALSPADGARLVVEGRALSLAEGSQGLAAVLGYRATLQRGGRRKADRVRDLAAAYSRRLSRGRGTTIARHELSGIYEEGLLQAAAQAERAGCLDRSWAYEWVARPTACPSLCAPLRGQRARVGESFPGGISRPPAHPRCECSLRLVRVRGRA